MRKLILWIALLAIAPVCLAQTIEKDSWKNIGRIAPLHSGTQSSPQAGPVSFVAWDKPAVSYPIRFTVRRSKTATGCADPLASTCTLLTPLPVDGTELPKPPTLSASVTCCWYADTLSGPGGWFYTVQTAFTDTDGSTIFSSNAKLQTAPPTGPDYALRVLLPPAPGLNLRIP